MCRTVPLLGRASDRSVSDKHRGVHNKDTSWDIQGLLGQHVIISYGENQAKDDVNRVKIFHWSFLKGPNTYLKEYGNCNRCLHAPDDDF